MIAKRPRAKRVKAPDTSAFAIGTLPPGRVAEPGDARELAAELRAVRDAAEAAIVYGGGTLQRAANPPARYDVAVSTRRLDALHDYDPRDLTIGLGAGTTVSQLSVRPQRAPRPPCSRTARTAWP